MIGRCSVLIVFCVTLGACTAPTSWGLPHDVSNASYVEPNRGLWLAPAQREFVTCGDGGLLACDRGIGRLSQTLCECLAPYDRAATGVEF